MDEFKGLPHCRRNRLRGKSAAVDDLENLIVQVVQLVLKSDRDNRHQDVLELQKHIRSALEGKNEGADGLENTQCRNALVVQEVAISFLVTLGGVPLQEFADDAHVRIAQLLAQRNGERREFSGEHLDKVLHDICQSIHINLVRELEKLLHDLRDVLLHRGADDIVPDEGLQSK